MILYLPHLTLYIVTTYLNIVFQYLSRCVGYNNVNSISTQICVLLGCPDYEYNTVILFIQITVLIPMRALSFSPIHVTVILLSLLASALGVDSLPKQFQIMTSPIITNLGRQNISICFADCDSCQSRTGECQKCFAPWYQLNAGRCILSSPSYLLESTQQEQRSNNFIASSEWIYNGVPVTSRVCVPNNQILTQNFTTIGPFGSGNVIYQRTISQHSYFGIKFLLILTNWTTADTNLRIRITNQANTVIAEQTLSLQTPSIANAYIQQLCSTSPLDKRASIILQVRQQQSSQLMIQFVGSMQGGASWSLSSFVLITGSCNPNCAVCTGYTPNPSGCEICKNFLANNESSGGQKCSTCLSGFALRPSQNRCYKCPIQFKQCWQNQRNNQTICQYPQISNQSAQCTLVNQSYFDNKQLTQDIFYGSLYTIQNKGSVTTRCGAYSVVGPASFGDIISRTFVQLPAHIQISINLNLFIFDQQQSVQRYSIVIIVDGQPVQFGQTQQTINITGTSSQCDINPPLIRYQAMKTFQTSSFIKHKKSDNVVIGVSLGTSATGTRTSWGVRDIRLVFKRCDQNCQTCTENGCLKCKGLFQLNDLQCSNCLVGTGLAQNNITCVACPDNCLQCNITNNTIKCVSCMSGFYLYQFNNRTTCEINPNFGAPVTGRLTENGGCVVNVPSNPNRTYNFDVAENRARRVFNLPKSSTGKNIQFYLMKLDNWEGDYLDIYANDLLVKRLQFGASGNAYCGAANQNDEMSLQQFNLQDNNQTLTLEFEAVHKDTTKTRRFGVADLKIYPVGCAQCKNYDFLYRAKYNYDQRLFVELAFNLIYENNNPQEFKNIFKLKTGQRYLDYQISANDSIRYWLKSQRIPAGEVLDQNVTVQCLYPMRVTAKIPTNTSHGYIQGINQYQFFDRRVLQAFNPNYQNVKTLDNNLASVFVDRFTPLKGREESVLGLQTFFSVLTRMVIYLGFASFFFGCQTPCTHVMHNFQKLWVHIFVACLALSPVLKTALWGFRQSQDQNIAINPDQWQSGLPRYLYYDAPAQYQHYYKDITFFRHIYNVGVAFAILLLVYIIFRFIFGRFKKSTNSFITHMRSTFVHRPLWFFNSIIFYQYFTVVLACFMQFLDLKTRTNQPAFAGVNAAACIIAFIFATLYPIIIHLILHRKRRTALSLFETIITNNRNKQFDNYRTDIKDLQQETVIYNNKYSQIFYRFLPKQLWNPNLVDSDLIQERHFFYNIFRFGDLWWHALVVILLWHSPFAQAFLLLLTNGFHLAVNTFATSLNTTKYFRLFKSLELVFFMVLQILIIVMNSLLKTLRVESYQTLGVVSLIFVFFIVVVTIIRFFYTLYRLIQQYRRNKDDDLTPFIRNDAGFQRGWTKTDYIPPL